VMLLAMISWATSLPSQVPDHEEDKDESVYKVSLRDVRKGSFGKICDTIGMFLYQAAVFLAQYTIYFSVESQMNLVGPRYVWLLIEMGSFYCYLGATAVYIAYFQIRSFIKNEENSDINKQITDFITYANINLTWFAFSFVLLLLPLMLIGIDHEDHSYQINDNIAGGKSYCKLMYAIFFMHLIQFVMNHAIFYTVADPDDDFVNANQVQEDADAAPAMPYRFMKRQFYGKMWWLWIVQAVLYCAVGVVYFMVPGKELVYAIYIPLDVMLTICLGAFYYSTYRAEKRREEVDDQMK